MKFAKAFCLLLTMAVLMSAVSGADVPRQPADAPARYRDFKVYTTSAPDAQDASRIVMTLQFHNEGSRALKMRVRLGPNAKAGFKGAETALLLNPRSEAKWALELRPADDLRYEVLSGDITFGATRERELFVAVQGPDAADFKEKKVEKITAKAEAVGTYAPRLQIGWWQSDTGTSLQASRRVKPLLTLASAGQTKYRIVVDPMPRAEDGSILEFQDWSKIKVPRPGEPEFIAAVKDLQRCIQIMSGAVLPVEAGNPKSPAPMIRLRLNDKVKWPHPDAYSLKTFGNDMVYIESGHLDGLRQGIYRLLTHHLDCHWFLPGQLGEEIPRPADRTVVIGQINESGKPTFFSSGGMSWGAHRDWDLRNRSYINRGRMTFGHAWGNLVPPSEESYKEHPDWWARDREGKIRRFDKGWSQTNFCTTSPEVIEMVAKKINAQLSDPNALVASLDPNDYGPMCLCDRCLALDAKYGVTDQDGTFVTDRLLHFSKEIHDRLEPQNKEKYLGILVYAYQMELPKSAIPHAHHTGMVCDMDWEYDHTRPFNDPTSPQNRDFLRLLKGWGKILPQFGFYDYYGQFRMFGPWGIVHKIREDLPAFRDLGGTYLMIEAQPNFAINGLNLYIAGRLAWDVDADVDVLMEEFFAKFYGPAAVPMRNYWLAMERHYALTRPGPKAIERVSAKPEMWREVESYLKAAETAVAGADKRFKDRIAFHRDGLELGRRQFEFMTKYGDPKAKLDPVQARADIKEARDWLNQMKAKYPGAEGYYPTLLASYFYPELEGEMARLEATIKAQEEGKPAPVQG